MVTEVLYILSWVYSLFSDSLGFSLDCRLKFIGFASAECPLEIIPLSNNSQ